VGGVKGYSVSYLQYPNLALAITTFPDPAIRPAIPLQMWWVVIGGQPGLDGGWARRVGQPI